MAKTSLKNQIEAQAPDPLKRFAYGRDRSFTIDELFSGEEFAGVRENLKIKRKAEIRDTIIAVDIDPETKKILAMAAAVPRTPIAADKYLKDNIPDLKATGQLNRKERIALYKQIYAREGIVNNAIKKKASLVSQDGAFAVRSAKQRNRKIELVANELLTLLQFWEENVNSADAETAITGSRGIRQVIRRGTRQSLITGDLYLRQEWKPVPVPQLGGKKYDLPMFLHPLPTEEVELVEDLVGHGIELFVWKPDRAKINRLTRPRVKEVKEIVQKSFSPEVLRDLQKNGQHILDPSLIIHIKNANTDVDAYGQSDVETALTDIAYSRALKSLDFVTIDSLVNRMVVIKIGDSNPDSDYHALSTAQARVNVFKTLMGDIGPNMFILWAGHDLETEEMGAHDKLLDTTDRHQFAKDAAKLAMGVPDPLLTGSADGGNAVAWAGFISLAAVVGETQEEWSQALSQLGMRIAEQNNFKDSEVAWQFAHKLLADREANAKLMVQAFDRGALSYRSLLEEMGKDFDIEKARREEEKEQGVLDLFAPPAIPMGGPSGNQGTSPPDQPGRPSREDDTKIGPERNREDKGLDKGESGKGDSTSESNQE